MKPTIEKPLRLWIAVFLFLTEAMYALPVIRQVEDITRYQNQQNIYEAQTKESQSEATIYTELTAIPLSQENNITKTQINMSGNKPPVAFEFANLETMRNYVFQTKDFSFSLPSAKQIDYTVMGGWDG